jgi:hypothetical protein
LAKALLRSAHLFAPGILERGRWGQNIARKEKFIPGPFRGIYRGRYI